MILRGRSRAPQHSWPDSLALLPLAAFAFYYSLRYGLRGFSSVADIVYYGGWQVANGQMPFLDFFVSYGAVQYLIQGALMKLFGSSWLVYCAHAAAVNALYVALMLILLRRFKLPLWVAFIYAWCAGITYYPSMGYPQPDKHSFLFLILALVLQLQVTKASSTRKVALLYALAALSYVLAFFCKANPTVLYPLAALSAMLWLWRGQWLAALAGGALSAVGVGVFTASLAAGHPGFFSDLLYYLVTLPGKIAAERGGGSLPLLKLGDYARFPSFTLSYAALVAGAGLLAARFGQMADDDFRHQVLTPLLLSFGFVAITVFHVTHIGQPPSAHVTLIVPAIALAHAAFLNGIGDSGGSRLSRRTLTLLLLVYVGVDVSEYNRVVVKRRLSYDIEMDIGAMQARGTVGPPELADVEYLPIVPQPRQLDEFTAVLQALQNEPGHVMTLGFSPWFYVFGQKAPVVPAIYVIPGHSTPELDSPEEEVMAKKLAANLERWDVRALILRPAVFDAAMQALEAEGLACGATTEEFYARIELCAPLKAGQTKIARDLLRLAGP